jgi:hypothetical protein
MPDLDIRTLDGPTCAYALLHDARPVLLTFAQPTVEGISRWADRVRHIDATHEGAWELPVLGQVSAPSAVLIRPDGHVAWVGETDDRSLIEALTRWFGIP